MDGLWDVLLVFAGGFAPVWWGLLGWMLFGFWKQNRRGIESDKVQVEALS